MDQPRGFAQPFEPSAAPPEEFESGMRKPLLLVRRAHNDSHGGASWAEPLRSCIRPLSEDIGATTSQSLLRDLVDTESGYFRDSHREDEDESCEATAQGFEQPNELTGVPKAAVFGTRKTVVGSIESLVSDTLKNPWKYRKCLLGSSKSASRRFRRGLPDVFLYILRQRGQSQRSPALGRREPAEPRLRPRVPEPAHVGVHL